jgi:hypothetical protein
MQRRTIFGGGMQWTRANNLAFGIGITGCPNARSLTRSRSPIIGRRCRNKKQKIFRRL